MSKIDIKTLTKNLWDQALSFSDYSYDDDFFELGGNSLKLLGILDNLQKAFPKGELNELTLIELFDNPTINELEILIQRKLNKWQS